MALSGEQWLQTHFFPVVDSFPAATAAPGDGPASPLMAFAALRLLGALDALADTGVLDAEQQQRSRSALEPKGVTTKQWEVRSVGLMTAALATHPYGEAAPPAEPDRLVRVVGDGRVFGIIDGEQAVLTSLEIWQRHVRASFLIATSPSGESERLERSRELREWIARRQSGEATAADRPPMPARPTHPGSDATWLLASGDTSTEGTVTAGHGGGEWWRMDVTWDVTAAEELGALEVSATEDGRVVGRTLIRW
jgi:hypothetical protein